MAAAYSLDGGNTFEKYPENPVVPHISFMNRDPKVVWEPQGENWVMFIFLDNCRYMLLYSKDLLHWEEGQVISLHTAAECPDLFFLPLDGDLSQGKWVLWGSTDTYMVGRFEGRQFVPEQIPSLAPRTSYIRLTATLPVLPAATLPRLFTGLPEGRVVQFSWIRTRLEQGPFFQLYECAEPAGFNNDGSGPPFDGTACEGGGNLVGKQLFVCGSRLGRD